MFRSPLARRRWVGLDCSNWRIEGFGNWGTGKWGTGGLGVPGLEDSRIGGTQPEKRGWPLADIAQN